MIMVNILLLLLYCECIVGQTPKGTTTPKSTNKTEQSTPKPSPPPPTPADRTSNDRDDRISKNPALLIGCLLEISNTTGCLSGIWNTENWSIADSPSQTPPVEYPPFDGWYNNIGKPELGAVDTPLLRRVPAAYKDGVYEPSGYNRPQPLALSERLLKGEPDRPTKSQTGKNALLVFFGQQVVEEILDAQRAACPPEYFNIKIPPKHDYNTDPKHSEMPVLRTRYDAHTGFSPNNPRQQLNEITPYIDGGLVYGTTKAWADLLRTYENGTVDRRGLLAVTDGFPEINHVRLPMANPPPPFHHGKYINDHETANVDRFYKLGNPRGNENPYLLTFGVIWFRWHNLIANTIYDHHPNWSSDKIFNEARKLVIATQQNIITNEWLPQFLNEDDKLPEYKGYDPSIDPQIDQFFQSAAFRFGHTLVPSAVNTQDYVRNGCTTKSIIRTCNSFWRPQEMLENIDTNASMSTNLDRLIMGMSTQLCEKEDHKIVEDLRGKVFGPLEFSRRDLMALNIQRGRDHGLPDYNTARKAYGLAPVKNVSYFAHVDSTILREFEKLYGNSMDDVDVWVGGILETKTGPGELFTAIIIDQFKRIRDGDRFWFQNTQNGLFNENQIKGIQAIKFRDILLAVTDISPNDIPKNPFRVAEIGSDHELVRCLNSTGHSGASILEYKPKAKQYFHRHQIIPESCSSRGTYDYFSSSEFPFLSAFIAMAMFIIGLGSCSCVLLKLKRNEDFKINARNVLLKVDNNGSHSENRHEAKEWVDATSKKRRVIIIFDTGRKQLRILNEFNKLLRAFDLSAVTRIFIAVATNDSYALIRAIHNYDLVLKFESKYKCRDFLEDLEQFLIEVGVNRDGLETLPVQAMWKMARTYQHRKKALEQFFRYIFDEQSSRDHQQKHRINRSSPVDHKVLETELTIPEFAEALGMPTDADFVQKIFNLLDEDKSGCISCREFLNMSVILAKSDADSKLKFVFDMYDNDHSGILSREQFGNMLRSFVGIVNTDFQDAELETLIAHMMKTAGLNDLTEIRFGDFKRLLRDHDDKISCAELELNVPNAPNQLLNRERNRTRARYVRESVYGKSRLQKPSENDTHKKRKLTVDRNESINNVLSKVQSFIVDKQLNIFWVSLYTIVAFGIFVERAYYFQVEREQSGIRKITGPGVTITRGAASAMMFTYSSLLLTMCRNIITFLRETVLQCYIPCDSMLEMHKYIGCLALFFTVLHVIGHGINFYNIATQTSDDLTCLFPNYFHSTHEIPKFTYWLWGTMTGFTGVLLTILTAIIFVFAIRPIRGSMYQWFSHTHSMYPIFYTLMMLHGTGRLIQGPLFQFFFIGPLILFTLDKVVAATRKITEIPIIKPQILPSGVTRLEFPKPVNFQYKSGQWVRIACSLLNKEYHPFTLSSAPHERTLTVHVRAVGPWTSNLHFKFQDISAEELEQIKISMDGPYGEAAQDWDKYEVAIMIGGGIGVTPYASILKDIVYKSNMKQSLKCKKIYFLWVTRNQRQLEWMVDVLRELQATDVNQIVNAQIFITEVYHNFDLRTILLYICEHQFQRVSNRSLFTGLTADTHFGRPNFQTYFKEVHSLHPECNRVGVFSCGTRSMIQSVSKACQDMNAKCDDIIFKNH